MSDDLIISMFRSTIHILLLRDPVALIMLIKGSVLTVLCVMLEELGNSQDTKLESSMI